MGLLRCSSGNLSLRLDAERFLISGSRSWLAEIRPEQVALCRLSDGASLNDVRPSVETAFHAGVLRRRADRNVVLHFQTPFATTLACREEAEKIDFRVLPEIAYYLGPVAVVPYFTPGTAELAAAVIEALAKHEMALLRNHGQVTVGIDVDDAIQKAVFFELACEVIVRGGETVRRLSPQDVAALEAQRRGAARAV